MMFRKRYHLIFVFSLFLLPFGRYYQILSGYWRWDDTAILLRLLKNPVWKYFCIPSVYQELSCSNLTPWVMLSYKGDLTLFGLNPPAFYLHHLLSLSFITVAGYYFLSLWLNKKFAFSGMVLFTIGAPVATVMQQLMTRHYLEGLLFAILGLYCIVLFLRRGKHSYLIAGVVFYFLSITAKEIYVPLVCLLPWIPEQTMKARLKAMIPFVIVVFLYVFWRQYMLGSLVGGYIGNPRDLIYSGLPIVFSAFANVPALLFGNWWKLFFAAYVVIIIFYVVARPSRFWHSIMIFTCITLPLVPLTISPGIVAPDRYLFLVWFAVSFSFASCFDRLYKKTSFLPGKTMPFIFIVIWFMVLVAIGTYGYDSGKRTQQLAREYDMIGRFVWMTNDKEVYFIPPPPVLASYWFISCLSKIKSHVYPNLSSPVGVIDGIFLQPAIKKLWMYDLECDCMKDISASLKTRISKAMAAVRKAPLSFCFKYIPGMVSWRFGPYDKGLYHLLADEFGARFLPREGALKARITDNFSFRLRYTSPAGWKTYSPPFTFEPHGMSINWERK